jgi:hypothetical protein
MPIVVKLIVTRACAMKWTLSKMPSVVLQVMTELRWYTRQGGNGRWKIESLPDWVIAGVQYALIREMGDTRTYEETST